MYYVYHLVDPRSGEVFYVGKGCRNRLDNHEREAKKGSDHPKCEVIRSIWQEGFKVDKKKVKHFVDEQQAYDFEAAEIKRIGLENLTNQQDGGGVARSAKTTEPIYAARLLLKYLARVLIAKALGYRFNMPWEEAINAMLPKTLKRLTEKYGKEFVIAELGKHNVAAEFEVA